MPHNNISQADIIANIDTLEANTDGLESVLGVTTGTKVITDANGTIQQYLRGLVNFLNSGVGGYVNLITGQIGIAAGAGAVAATVPRVTLASDDPAVASLALLTPVTTAGAGIVPVVSTSLETGHVIKASAGNLYRINCAATTVAGNFLVHNSATVPAAGAVTPVKSFPVGIGQAVAIDFMPPLRLSTGISISFSSATTPFTQTDSATAFISGDAV